VCLNPKRHANAGAHHSERTVTEVAPALPPPTRKAVRIARRRGREGERERGRKGEGGGKRKGRGQRERGSRGGRGGKRKKEGKGRKGRAARGPQLKVLMSVTNT
jgi:hypothetical protein